MSQIADTYISETFLTQRDSNHPVTRHERVLAQNLDNFQEDLEDELDVIEGDISDLEAQITAFENGSGVIDYTVTEGAASIKIFDANAPFRFEIVDVVVRCGGNSANGTMKLTDGATEANDITNGIVCAVKGTSNHAATIDPDYAIVDEDGSLEIVCAGDQVADTIGLVTIFVIPRPVE